MNKERTELNKGNVIEIRCKKCNKLMMEYFVCGDDSAVALQNIGIKCDRCKRDDTQEVFRGNDET